MPYDKLCFILNLQAQAMKEQAQLREEMAYHFKLGHFEVRIILCFCLSSEFDSRKPSR